MINPVRREYPPIVRISIVALLPIHERIHAALAIRWELSVDQYFRIRAQGGLDRNLVRMMQAMPATLLDNAIERAVALQPRPMHNAQTVASMKEEAQRKLITEDTRLLCAADLALEKAFAGVVDDGSIEGYWSLVREHPELHERCEKAMLEGLQGLITEHCQEVMAARQREINALGLFNQHKRASIIHKYAVTYHAGLVKRFEEYCLREAENARGSVVALYWYKKLVFYGSVLLKVHSQATLKKWAEEHAFQRQHWSCFFFIQDERSMRIREDNLVEQYQNLAREVAAHDEFGIGLYREDIEGLERSLERAREQLSPARQEEIADIEYERTDDIIRAIPRFSHVERLLYDTSFGLRLPRHPPVVNVAYFYNQVREIVIQRLHTFVAARAPAKG